MPIDKAIELLSDHRELILVDKNPDLKASVQLGIEALKAIKWDRICHPKPWSKLLPGETKE